MPAYQSIAASTPYSLFPGDSYQVWNAEQPVAGSGLASASERVALAVRAGSPAGFAVTGFFSAAPGAFEIDVQVSDVDADAQYQTVLNGNITTVDAINQTFHYDLVGYSANFARLLMRSRANAVKVTADIRRL